MNELEFAAWVDGVDRMAEPYRPSPEGQIRVFGEWIDRSELHLEMVIHVHQGFVTERELELANAELERRGSIARVAPCEDCEDCEDERCAS